MMGFRQSEVRKGYPGDINGNGHKPDKPNMPTHDELRDRWMEDNPGHAYGMAGWWRYEAGIWRPVDELVIKQGICAVVEAAKAEGIRPTASLVSSVTEMAKVKTFVPEDRWNANPDILVCQNGTLNIPSSELKEHSPEHYVTSAVPYAYDRDSYPTIWELFLKTIVPDATEFLQEFAGYALTTDTSHELALWLSGPRGSGKSTALLGLQTMLGARSGVLGLSDIERNRFALANLPGKTLVVATEQPSSFIRSTDVLNAIISGEPIQVERKYKDAYEITPRAKIAWAMNETPRVSEANNGLFRRVKVVQFPALAEDERDPRMKAMITEEGPGILNWALEGLQRLRERGYFDIPECVQDATREFQEANDIPASFVEECCVREPGTRTQAGRLYKEYKAWCEESGHRAMSSTRMASEWERLGIQKYPNPIEGKRYYTGIRLRLPSE